MHKQDEIKNDASDQETKQPAAQPQEPSAMTGNKMMLVFGGMMAVCCALPLLLASGLSLAWFTESPAVGVGAAAIALILAWRFRRKGSACSSARQQKEKAAMPSDQV